MTKSKWLEKVLTLSVKNHTKSGALNHYDKNSTEMTLPETGC